MLTSVPLRQRRMKYRPDIDGLRCLAVAPVVLCHAGVDYFSGGFVGVDVFFVISGFLITSIIRREMARDAFTIAGFYERRCRRILPALIVVILFCVVVGYFTMLPGQYSAFAESAIAALLFISNVFFWLQAGYFAPVSEWMPLLHTWSLAVEEQYYIVFPIFMLFTRRWRVSRQLAVIGFVFAASLAVSVYGAYNKPSATFYLAPFRAWELLGGVIIAYWSPPSDLPRWLREAASVIGLLLLLLPVVLFDDRTPFPGLAAVPPCLGTAILLVSGQAGSSVVRSILEHRVLVFVGLISYSLYLWHWPVFVFMRLRFAQTGLTPDAAALGTVLSVGIAILSWRFVEQPFRRKGVSSRNAVFRLSAAAVGFSLVVTGVIYFFDGFPEHAVPEALAFERASKDVDPVRMPCHGEIDSASCEFGSQDATPTTYALWGDSHAAAFRPALEEAMSGSGRRGTLIWLGGCPPLLGLEKVGEPDVEECDAFRQRAVDFLSEPGNSIKTVFLSGRWLTVATGVSAEVGGSFVQLTKDAESESLGPEENRRVFIRSLNRTIEALLAGGKDIVLIGGVPDIGWDVPTVLALSAQHHRGVPRVASRRESEATHAAVDRVFAEAAQRDGVMFIPIWPLLCPKDCLILVHNRAIYSDDDHLSLYGARRFLGPSLKQAFEATGIQIGSE